MYMGIENYLILLQWGKTIIRQILLVPSTFDSSLGICFKLAKHPWEGNENWDAMYKGIVSFDRFREIRKS